MSSATVLPTLPRAAKVHKQSSHGAVVKHIPTNLSKHTLLHTENFNFQRVIFVTEVLFQHFYPCKEKNHTTNNVDLVSPCLRLTRRYIAKH